MSHELHPEAGRAAPFRHRARRGFAGRLWRAREGAVAAEFGMIAPLLIAIFMGILEFGTMLYSYSAMQMSAREVTRQISVNSVLPDAAQDAARARVPGWMADDLEVTVAQSAPGNPAANIITLTAAAPASAASVLPFFSRAAGWELSTVVEMRQEAPFVAPGT